MCTDSLTHHFLSLSLTLVLNRKSKLGAMFSCPVVHADLFRICSDSSSSFPLGWLHYWWFNTLKPDEERGASVFQWSLEIQCLKSSWQGTGVKSVQAIVWRSSLNPDDGTVICGQESKRAKLALLFGWEGWHTLPTLSITARIVSHGRLWSRAYGQMRNSAFLCDAGWAVWKDEDVWLHKYWRKHVIDCTLPSSETELVGGNWPWVN